ncbi:MAG: hypothetical protein K5924_01105 [Chloroflexi bacterium]|nr:hypothetical protein [Chloroflexota bacterium]
MAEPLLLLVGALVAGAVVLAPLRRPRGEDAADDAAAAVIRHRVALEALRDVETDRRAGSLDDAAYAVQLAEAEERAARTKAALAAVPVDGTTEVAAARHDPRRTAVIAAVVVAAVLIVGAAVPATGIGNRTETNQALADVQAVERERQAEITRLLGELDPQSPDPAVVSDLADAYLAGSSREDLVRAAASLQLLIGLEPERADAYERIMSAYLRAGDAANARSAHASYAALPSADPVEEAFFDGLIALRGEGDPDRARAAFERFLEAAPDDPRAGMIRALLEDVATEG